MIIYTKAVVKGIMYPKSFLAISHIYNIKLSPYKIIPPIATALKFR